MLTITKSSATIGTTEYYLASASTVKTAQTTECWLQLVIDFGNLVAGDIYEVRFYEKINSTDRTVGPFYVSGVQSEPFVSQPMLVGEGWEWSVKKQSGTDRSIGWSLRKEVTQALDSEVETSFSVKRYLKIIGSAVAGQRDSDGNFDSLAGTEDQIVGTAGDGTRTGITYGA